MRPDAARARTLAPSLALALALALAVALVLPGCIDLREGASDGPQVAFDAIQLETDQGMIRAIVFCNETPKTCVFMRDLIEGGYYDGRAFGRIIPGFVIQEVDRTGGTTDQSEKVEGEFGTNVTFSAGAFGIARDADPNSGGSEFFVMDFATSHLWGNYTAFAQVVEGLDVVHAIARVPAVRTGPASSVVGAPPGSPVILGVHDRVPVQPPKIIDATWTTIDLPASQAARYPLLVFDSTTAAEYRATLEAPRDLSTRHPSDMTWYVAPRGGSGPAAPTGMQDPPPVDLDGVIVRIDGPRSTSLVVQPNHAGPDGILTWQWRPAFAGNYQVRLVRGNEEMALANVTIDS